MNLPYAAQDRDWINRSAGRAGISSSSIYARRPWLPREPERTI